MKQFFQLIIGAIVVGLICLGISHWFNSQDHTKTGKKVYVYNWGEYIDQKLKMVVHIMMLHFQVNILFKN